MLATKKQVALIYKLLRQHEYKATAKTITVGTARFRPQYGMIEMMSMQSASKLIDALKAAPLKENPAPEPAPEPKAPAPTATASYTRQGQEWCLKVPAKSYIEGNEVQVTKRNGASKFETMGPILREGGDHIICSIKRSLRTCPICGEHAGDGFFDGESCTECGFHT